jgi:hypothetical protein
MIERVFISSFAQISSVVQSISGLVRRLFVAPSPAFALLHSTQGEPSVYSPGRSIHKFVRDWVCATWQRAPQGTHSTIEQGQRRWYTNKSSRHSDKKAKRPLKGRPTSENHVRPKMLHPPQFPSSHYPRALNLLKRFSKDPGLRERALENGIPDDLFSVALHDYRSLLHANAENTILGGSLTLEDEKAFETMFNHFLNFCKNKYQKRIEKHKLLVETLDMSNPKSWYPMARSMTRKIIYHTGPTNSGKTYNALKAMSEASSGVYLGPLRLL